MADITPAAPSERIASVDTLRGFSLLGILLLNIAAFGLPFSAYSNPSAYGGHTGRNLTTWFIAQTFFDGKMRCIFSMLFGTSGLILLARAEERGAGIAAADIYYRRVMWLILFGLFHAYLIWSGDILYAYGVIGLLLFPLRKLSARALIIAGCVIITFHCFQNLGAGFGIQQMSVSAAEADKQLQQGKPLTSKQKKEQNEWASIRDLFQPDEAIIDEEIQTHRSNWLKNLGQRASESAMIEFNVFFQFVFLDVLGMLVLGMGLWKAGVFDASRSYRFYVLLAVIGFGIGVPLNYWAARTWVNSGFNVPDWFRYIASTSDPGRFLVAGGYIGIIMILCKSGKFRRALTPLAAVGRTALSNYLLTSILCTLFFNGYGLGMYAKLQRYQLYEVVLGMWAINLVASSIWLRYFRFGPAEWLWRSLTYWKKQPMRMVRQGLAEVATA